MLERLSRVKRNVALGILALLVGWFCWSIRSVLNPLLLGYLLAYILHPLVRRVQKRGLSRRAAVNLTFFWGFALVTIVGLVFTLQVRSLAIELSSHHPPEQGAPVAPDSGPGFQHNLQVRLDEFTDQMQEWGLEVGPWSVPDLAELRAMAGTFLAEHGDNLQAASVQAAGRGFAFLARFFGGLAAFAGMFLLVPLYTYYLLFEQNRINEFVKRYLPKRDRQRIADVAEKIGDAVAGFFRGRLSVCLIKGVLLSAGLMIADVPYALLFGLLSGMLSIVPFFGPLLGFALALVIGTTAHGLIPALVRVGLVFGLGELIEGYVLMPRILGEKLGLHPMVVFFALLAGGASMGLLGVLVAIPLTAALVILVQEFVLPALTHFADEDSEDDVSAER